jgi:DNA-directed RNA polymerase specialized sigma24 family protein
MWTAWVRPETSRTGIRDSTRVCSLLLVLARDREVAADAASEGALASTAALGARPRNGDEVWELLRALTARQQQAIVLRYVTDLPESDIARVMGVTRGTVASTLAQARQVLGEALREVDAAEEPS